MGFRIAAEGAGSRLTVFVDYALPSGAVAHGLARLLGGFYARWCCTRMLRDAQAAFGVAPSTRGG